MRAAEVWRSSAFRWAVAVASALVLQAAVLFAFFWWHAVTQAVAAVDASLALDCPVMAALPRAELLDVIEDRLHSDLHRVQLAGLFGADGTVLAGNIAQLPAGLPRDGTAHAPEIRRRDAPDVVERFTRTVACAAGVDTLVLARAAGSFQDTRALVAQAIGLGALPAVLIALGTGALLGTRSQAHIRRVRQATERIIAGKLEERLPVRGTPDDLDRLSGDVNRMLDRMASLLEQVRHVGNDIAHDLRTPLTRLRVGLERGVEDAQTPEQFLAVGERALAEADHALAIIAALLRIAEIEHSRQRAAFGPVAAGTLMRDVAELYAPVADEREVRLVLELQPCTPLFADRDLMMEAMANLVENAVKFSPVGGIVHLRLHPGPLGATVIEVADHGPGIAPDEREAVFQRFHRTDRSRGTTGNGLGLALVRAITELHGFAIEIGDAASGCIMRLTAPAAVGVKHP